VPAQKLLEIVATAVARNPNDVVMRPTPKEAWQFAIDSVAPGECICIAGSFYLAA